MEEKQKIIRIGLVALIIIVLGISAYYYFFSPRSGPSGAGAAALEAEKIEGESVGAKDAVPVAPLSVTLDQSDAAVRTLAGELSANPVLARWLREPDLLRRFVAAVDNISNGLSPRPQLEVTAPAGVFKTVTRGGKTTIDPSSYTRYNIIADVFDSVNGAGLARAYEASRALLQQAYRELGYPQGDFHRTIFRAIVEILRTPVVESPIELEKDIITFRMTDPVLEDLSPAQKHLLRMGPENLQLIQMKLREVALALGFGETQLPAPQKYRTGAI